MHLNKIYKILSKDIKLKHLLYQNICNKMKISNILKYLYYFKNCTLK